MYEGIVVRMVGSEMNQEKYLTIRLLGYYLVVFAFWMVWSAPHLLSGDHLAFQSSGAIIVVVAIVKIGLTRIRFENELSEADRNAIISAVNRLEAHRKINEDRLDLTFNLQLLQLSKLCAATGVRNEIGPTLDSDIKEFERRLSEQTKNLGEFYEVSDDKILIDSIKNLNDLRNQNGPWKKHTFRCELIFLCVGTLQASYGAIWSETFSRLTNAI